MDGQALAIGLAIVYLNSSFGHVSGAHFNPVITLSFTLLRSFPLWRVPFYIASQFLGAIFAALALESLFGDVHHLGGTRVKGNFTRAQAFSLELFVSFMFISVVLAVARRGKIVGVNAAAAVGCVAAVGAFMAAPFGGGAMNPFRSLAAALLSQDNDLPTTWIYVVAPLIASAKTSHKRKHNAGDAAAESPKRRKARTAAPSKGRKSAKTKAGDVKGKGKAVEIEEKAQPLQPFLSRYIIQNTHQMERDRVLAEWTCVLCPKKEGAVKRVGDSDMWVHVLCVWWNEDVEFDENTIANIDLEAIYPKCWDMVCSLCTNEDNAKFGCKIPCQAHGCKKSFHATCAADLGLLEEVTDEDMADPWFQYCKQHGSADEPQLNRWARWVRQKEKVVDQFTDPVAQNGITSQQVNDPRPFLESAYADMKRRQEGEIRHLLHEQCRLEAAKWNVDYDTPTATEELNKLEGILAQAREDVQIRKDATDALKHNILSTLVTFGESPPASHDTSDFSIIEAFVQSGDTLALDPAYATMFLDAYHETLEHAPKPPPPRGISSNRNSPALSYGSHHKRRRHGAVKAEPTSAPSSSAGGDLTPPSVRRDPVGLCSVCKTFESSVGTNTPKAHRLVECERCHKLFHFGCVDPPLEKPVPRGFAWRCEACDSSTDDEEVEQDGIGDVGGVKKEDGDEASGGDVPLAQGRARRVKTGPPARYSPTSPK
ncbi:hypothetical protein HDV00_001097 [Rhizophlyctis rosea]|nr:hypothetical protein HDV00_001097 [Rhizophlyctis rosea]